MAAAGAGTLTAGSASLAAAFSRPLAPTDIFSWFLVTDDPRGDLGRLRDALGLRSFESFRLSASSIAPSGQDITVLDAGNTGSSRIIDPSLASNATDGLRDLTLRLRHRRTPGTTLLSIEPVRSVERKEITFEVDGRIVDVIPASGSWNRVEIDGRQGRTIFRLDEDGLTITESSCRHELCRRFGARRNGRIICAPNRLVAHLPSLHSGLSGVTG